MWSSHSDTVPVDRQPVATIHRFRVRSSGRGSVFRLQLAPLVAAVMAFRLQLVPLVLLLDGTNCDRNVAGRHELRPERGWAVQSATGTRRTGPAGI
jgi:hypothetical protein